MVCEESVGVEMPKGAAAAELGAAGAGPPAELRRRVWPQHTAALLATLLAMSGGIVMGWSTPAVPYLQTPMPLGDGSNATTLPITDEEGSWLGSLSAIGALVGAAPAGFLSDLVGRKRMLLLFSIPLIASWVMIILVDRNMPLLYIARILGGTTIGTCYTIIPVYGEEISEVRCRGAIGTYCEIMICAGVEVAFVAGTYLRYLHFLVFSCALPAVFLLTFLWMPESPMWLLMKGRDGEAERSLRWLRGAGPGEDSGVSKELEDMRVFLRTEAELASSESTEKLVTPTEERGSWMSPAVKATVIVFWLMVFQQMTGNNAVMFNTVSIFEEARVPLDSSVAAMVTGLLQVLAAVTSCFVVDRTGRRPLLIFSMMVSCVLLSAMALYFQFRAQLQGVSWLPVAVISAYIYNMEVGLGPLPWLILAELAPPRAKRVVGAIGGSACWCLLFAVTKSYTDLVAGLGLAATYGVYAGFCFAGSFFVYFVVPETKHRTREQIQHELRFGGRPARTGEVVA